MSNHLWKSVTMTVVVAVAIAVPSLAAEQAPAQPVQKQTSGKPSKAITDKYPSGESTVATRPIVLLLVRTGTIAITPSVIAGGGGSSSGGSFSISGTIGQPAAGGAMTGSNFIVTSGFWASDAANPPAKKKGGQITSQD